MSWHLQLVVTHRLQPCHRQWCSHGDTAWPLGMETWPRRAGWHQHLSPKLHGAPNPHQGDAEAQNPVSSKAQPWDVGLRSTTSKELGGSGKGPPKGCSFACLALVLGVCRELAKLWEPPASSGLRDLGEKDRWWLCRAAPVPSVALPMLSPIGELQQPLGTVSFPPRSCPLGPVVCPFLGSRLSEAAGGEPPSRIASMVNNSLSGSCWCQMNGCAVLGGRGGAGCASPSPTPQFATCQRHLGHGCRMGHATSVPQGCF